MTLNWRSGVKSGTVSSAQLLAWGQRQLSAPHEARLLLEWATETDSLLALSEVGYRAAERYRSGVAQRRRGFPLQHITGVMHFRSLKLDAGPGVFCVRPETEMLVEYALELPDVSRVVDLCAGSGAVGLALEVESGSQVDAVELSEPARKYALRNLERYQARLRLFAGDALGLALPGTYDLVISNPPYVPGEPRLGGDVLFDPEMALYGGGEDGMVLPRGIITRARELLRPGGHLLMEHDETQADALARFALGAGFEEISVLPDLTGRPRFLRARQPGRLSDEMRACLSAVARGEVIIVPTDTVYGIGADPYNPQAVTSLLGAKGRGQTMPPPLLAATAAEALALGSWTEPGHEARARRLAEAFWPGALTLIIPTTESLGWDTSVTGGTVAVRVPDQELTRELLAHTGPLAVTSANFTGEPPAENLAEAQAYFPQMPALDGGCANLGSASTIIDVVNGSVIRVGALDLDAIKEVLG